MVPVLLQSLYLCVVLWLSPHICEAVSTTPVITSTSTSSIAPSTSSTSAPSSSSTSAPSTSPTSLPTSFPTSIPSTSPIYSPTSSPTMYFMTEIPSESTTDAVCPESTQRIETIEECRQAAQQVVHPGNATLLSLEKCFTSPNVLLTYLATVVGPDRNPCNTFCTTNSSTTSVECEQCVIDKYTPELYPYGCYWKEEESFKNQYDDCNSAETGFRVWFNPLGTVEKSDILAPKTYMAICNKGPPTSSPTSHPPTASPTNLPTTNLPTHSPTTRSPTKSPTTTPTPSPTIYPTSNPTTFPSINPTQLPTGTPTELVVVTASSSDGVPALVLPVAIAGAAVFIVALLIVVCVCRRLRYQDKKRQAMEKQGTVLDVTERYQTLTAVALASEQRVHRNVDDVIRCALRMNSEIASLGITFGGALTRDEGREKGMGVFIYAVEPGSEASRHPELRQGLQITRVQGHDLQSIIVPDFEEILAVHQNRLLLHFELMENRKLYEAYANITFSRQQSLMRISSFAAISPEISQQHIDTGYSRNTSFSALDEHDEDAEGADTDNNTNHADDDKGNKLSRTNTKYDNPNSTDNTVYAMQDVVGEHDGGLTSSTPATTAADVGGQRKFPPLPPDMAEDSTMSNRNSYAIPVAESPHRSISSSTSLAHLANAVSRDSITVVEPATVSESDL
eukprot:m.115022 g.115022  ORF g.115022 m.115022 type:complete len:678 (-) comp28391_c1_seq1:208-2241(-)